MSELNEAWGQQLMRYAKAVVNEAVIPAAEKLIPQGASEVAQALYAGNGFVPYGPTNQPVPIESQGAYGMAAEQPSAQPDSLQPYATTDPKQSDSKAAESSSLYGTPANAEASVSASYESELSRYAARSQEQQPSMENER